MKIRDQIDLVGSNKKHVIEWVRARRPDVLATIEAMWDRDDLAFLMAIAYQAGRASVVAEVDGITITEAVQS